MLEKTKTNAKRVGLILMAVLLAAGCWWGYGIKQRSEIPQLTTFVDSTGTIEVEEEEVPLAKPKVTTKKTTKTKKKTVKLKKKSKKTYTKKKPTKTKTTTKTTTKGKTTTKVEKKVVTKVTEKYKKNSKKKTVTTKTITTIKTTVTTKETEQGNSTVSGQNKTTDDGAHYVDKSDRNTTATESKNTSDSSTSSKKKGTYDVSIEQSAPLADDAVLKAYETLGFTVTINPSVSYAGYFNAKNQSIVLREDDDTIYHELGHFLAFIAGNVDTKDAFKAVYKAEKGKYNGTNKAYVTQNSSEYFAESYRDYVLNPSGLQASRPETYASIQRALNKITDSWIQTIKMAYSPVWK